MEITTCRNCGKIFNHIRGQLICPVCQKEMDGKFKEVKKYVYDNPRVGIQELSTACEVSVGQINRWIREERLTFSEDSPIGISCEGCGASIKTGRYCQQCKNTLSNDLNGAISRPHSQEPEKKRPATRSGFGFLDTSK